MKIDKMTDNILEIKRLYTSYFSRSGTNPVLKDINLYLQKDECVSIVGESGCGKSTLALAAMGLISSVEGEVRADSIDLNISGRNIDLSSAEETLLKEVRGNAVSLVMQDPYNSLNPVVRIGSQMKEAVMAHQNIKKYELESLIKDKLEDVHLNDYEKITFSFPHQLSGGMLQRVNIAMALLNSPPLLIADEPTSSLDVTIQKYIIENLLAIKEKSGLSLLFITHNLNLISSFSDRMYVMYKGMIVEHASAEEIFRNPRHPYTVELISSLPSLKGRPRNIAEQKKNSAADIPSAAEECPYNDRCSMSKDICRKIPDLKDISASHKHQVRCHLCC